jgi:DNA-binding NarL/FixJ family response regulator
MSVEGAARRIVLAVDDNPGSLGALTETLESAGMMALSAPSGQSALAVLDRITPDLILLDAVMPGLDGFETCRKIKARPALETTPVVFLTGSQDTQDVLSGLRAGGVDYVVKPFEQTVLIERIRVHISNADLVREARAALDATGPGVFAIGLEQEIAWASETALQTLGLEAQAIPPLLKVELQKWLKVQATKPISQTQPLLFNDPIDRALSFTLIGRMANGDMLVQVEPYEEIGDAELLTRDLGLSPREGEVLAWLAQGKSNRDIAEILDLSTRTVTKHIEQIFQKLGVENRTAAALAALKAINSRSGNSNQR